MTISFTVEDSIAGLRGDHVIRARHPDVDREFALKLLKGGRIRIAGAVANLKTLTAAGDTVVVDIAEGRLGPALSPRFVVLREDRRFEAAFYELVHHVEGTYRIKTPELIPLDQIED